MPPQVEIKELLGAIDTDSPPEVIASGMLRSARNVEWFGQPPNLRAQTIKGNTLVPNALLPGTGVNLTIGCRYDPIGKRLFIFNFNSAGNHAIFIYNTLLGTFQRLVQSGVNTQGDVLAFTATGRIHSIEIIYGDGNAGDLLIFIDSLKRVRKLNIQRLLNGGYAIVKDSYLKLIKAPPVPTPYCTYENDTTVQANNMINALFNIACTHIYDDFEQSVIGSAARQVYPSDPFDPKNNLSQSRNSRMSIYVPTGDQNVTKIRILGKQTKDGVTTDWFVIDTLIKADLGIGDNTFYRYLFYNNGNYVTAPASLYANNDLTQGQLDFDWIPQFANCMALLNGNTVSLGGCTEGYDYVNPSFNITTGNVAVPDFALNGTLFFGGTNGIVSGSQPQVTLYLTGVGTNDGFGNPITLEKYPGTFFVKAKSNGANISFSAAGGTTSIADDISRLQTAATGAGWTFVSSTTNSITIFYPTGTVVFDTAFLTTAAADTSPFPTPVSSHYPQSSYAYGLLYRDVDGRTNGVISNVTGNIKTQTVSAGQIPLITLDMSGFTPPTWAVYYEIVRTDTLTYSKYLNWVSDAAYSAVGAGTSTQFAYFGLTNIATYNVNIKATEGVIKYGFSQGDRIRITGRYAADGTFTPLNFDYAILGTVNVVSVNGMNQTGLFAQIYFPTADINANFKFDGTSDFMNYEIVLYNYKAQAATNQNVFFQIGQQYSIGNPGLVTAFHMGNIADNQVQLTDGDVFYRQRTVPLTNTYFVPTGTYTQGSPYGTVWVAPGTEAVPIVDNGIWKIRGDTNKVAGLTSVTFPSFVDNNQTVLNESAAPFNVRIRWTVNVTDTTDPNGQWQMFFKVVPPSNIPIIINVLPLQTGLKVGVQNTYTIDQTFSLPAGAKVWLVNFAQNEMLVSGGNLQIDIIRDRTINVFDASFSDIYALVTNSDNKPSIVDTTAAQTFYSTLFRWGQAYQLGTELNNSNRFFPLDFDEFDKSYGQIQRLYVWQRELRIFQERRCGHVGVYAKFIKDNNGNNVLVTVDDIISKNNIEYFEGAFGLGNNPTGLISSGFQNYFPDPIRGCWLRLSLDGLKNISEEFHSQSFAGNNLPNYLNQYTYQFGGNAVLLGCYNFKKDKDGEVIFMLQGGTGALGTIPGQSMAFNERFNAFTGEYDFNFDDIVCCENQLFSFSNGKLFIHNNTTTYANFCGVQYNPSVEIIFNDKVAMKKTFLTLSYQANQFWEAFNVGDIFTSLINPQTGFQQISQLIAQDFEITEGLYTAAYLYDGNSGINQQLAIVEGDKLKGFYIRILLTYRGSNFAYIYAPTNKYIDSPKNM